MILPAISSLPSADPRFRAAIEDVALIAEGLIVSIDAAMLAIPLPSDRWEDDMPIVAWSQRLAASAPLARDVLATPMFTPVFDALCLASNTVFARLTAWGWADCDAPGLCLVTDGDGIVLSTTRPPVAAGCGWLLDLTRPGSGAKMVRRPHASGAWSLITAETKTAH